MAFALGLSPIAAAGAQMAHPIHWSVRGARVTMRSGDTASVSLHATIDEFFHLYSTTQGPGGPVPTTIALLPSQPFRLIGKVRAPAPDTIPDGNFGIMTEIYDDSVSLSITLAADTSLSLGRASAALGIRYQTCTARYCLPPRVDTLLVPVTIAGRMARVVAAHAEPVRESTRSATPSNLIPVATPKFDASPPVENFGRPGNTGAFLILAATMGALALLTPCVFPMVPITVTSFLGNSGNRPRALQRASLYAIGIIGSFTGLGVVTAAFFGASKLARFSANPMVNLAIAGLFILFALSLLGVVRLTLPTSLVERVSRTASGGGAASTLAMGAVFTLTAFTCTAPFVGTLLVMAAQGSWLWPLVGMLVFSTVFAAPFFLLALVPSVLERRPRAGDWMPALEITLGAIELAAAVKFISNADLVYGWGFFTRQRILVIWIAILGALVVALLWPIVARARVASTPRIGKFRIATSAVVLALAATLVPGLLGRRLGELDAFLPPMAKIYEDLATTDNELPWHLNSFRETLLNARRNAQPILVDFTGYTCTNCRWMEANMFPRADIQKSLKRFIRVRLYTDGLGEPFTSQQALEQRMFGTVALPLYAVLDSEGHPQATFLGMTRDPREFLEFLERGFSRQ
jgi:thiol:disulfide interchange protein